ncbi:lysostaphin resistance A-like protein [Saccharothrix sp. Mg75]|uniref:CPBP family intramembrane glutamic endopeptidase n=1 Tax=Saccharothrix sp. Mg75 TaxID=3445357 RepID=UPI003EF07A5B
MLDKRSGVLLAGVAVIVASATWLLVTGHAGIRYSADHHDTVPMWHRWVPALVGIALVRLVPPAGPLRDAPARGVPPAVSSTGVASTDRTLRVEAVALLAAALAFAVSLRLVTAGEPAHTLLKTTLLVVVPLVLFRVSRRGRPLPVPTAAGEGWRRLAPAAPVAAWLVLGHATPLAVPAREPFTRDAVELVAVIVVVFVVNALLEEVFYRRWLQTRWEHLLGPWPAVVLASLVWAAWHIGIQGTGDLARDLASAFVNQGVTGLFLGYLWSRYRVMWPLLVVHGAVNALPLLLSLP